MSAELREPTTLERETLLSTPSFVTTEGNLLKVMGVYAVVNRCAWFPVDLDHPELDLPSLEAIQAKALDLGRHCYLWLYDRVDSLQAARLVDMEDLPEWSSGSYRLGLSNTGLDRNNVKIEFDQAKHEPDKHEFFVYPNTGSSSGDYDVSIKLKVRFAEGMAKVFSMTDELAWLFMLGNCDGDRYAGHDLILEEGWIG